MNNIIRELEKKFSPAYINKMNSMLEEIKIEYLSARTVKGEFNSLHEGYAIIKEEFDELWEEIKLKNPNQLNLQKEAVQVGAMVLAFLVELVQ